MSEDRYPECVKAWPDCHTGGYDPRCCRFPKSCSATIGVNPPAEDRYSVLQDAVTKTRYSMTAGGEPGPDWVGEVRHLDTLQAILDRHKPVDDGTWCPTCAWVWPCPDVLTVETALRNMGAL